MIYAPVKIITLNRSSHFIRLMESLKRNVWAKYTEIFVGLDYPPSEKYRSGWEKICTYLDQGDFSVFKDFHVIRRTINFGAKNNSLDLTRLIYERFDRVISMEDDLEVSPDFLEYMDKCLDQFKDDPDVIAVSGYSYPIKWNVDTDANCFKQNICASMWGIGWWKSKYEKVKFDIETGDLLKRGGDAIKGNIHNRMIDAARIEYVSAITMPFKRMKKWMLRVCDVSVRPYLAVYDKYIISPVVSKVRNHGFDGSGLYCQQIENAAIGNTAGTYNYSNQPIDNASSFEMRLDDIDTIAANRDELNLFDYRSSKQLSRTRRLLWLIKHLGLWSAKIYTICCTPFDIAKRCLIKFGHIKT